MKVIMFYIVSGRHYPRGCKTSYIKLIARLTLDLASPRHRLFTEHFFRLPPIPNRNHPQCGDDFYNGDSSTCEE